MNRRYISKVYFTGPAARGARGDYERRATDGRGVYIPPIFGLNAFIRQRQACPERARRLREVYHPEAALARNILAKTNLPVLPTAEVSSQMRVQEQSKSGSIHTYALCIHRCSLGSASATSTTCSRSAGTRLEALLDSDTLTLAIWIESPVIELLREDKLLESDFLMVT
ncbi:hypothetical protein EVAR_63844_1 [Eumeta japonica]|uniref:Uncharacterized protein n=1 Tax=Eumeta variegata TaxID=151549 RepID=A0A4C1Z435_EUMVA|nr:hypothetical protein EVAR_63844_1 [Eumeta japonica]